MKEKRIWILVAAIAVVVLVGIAGMAACFTGMMQNGQLVDQLLEEKNELILQNRQLQEQSIHNIYTPLIVLDDDGENTRYEALVPNDPEADYVYLKVPKEEMKRLHEEILSE